MDECVRSCAGKFAESKKARDEVAGQFAKANTPKIIFEEFDRAEFDKHFQYGYQPILRGMDYYECENTCRMPKNISGRAAEIGKVIMDEFYEKCLSKTKNFNHIKHHYEIDVIGEMKCHVMRREISI